MAITVLKKITPSWYTPEAERGQDNPARFLLRPLTPSEKEMCLEFEQDKGFHIPPRNYGQVLRIGLLDWENLQDENGSNPECVVVNHDLIPGDIRIEIAFELLTRSNLEESQTKNS